MSRLKFKMHKNYCYLYKQDIMYIKVLIKKQYDGSGLVFCKKHGLNYKVFYKHILDNRGVVARKYLKQIETKIKYKFKSLDR